MSTPLPPGWSTFYDPSSGQWVYTNLQTGAQQYDPPIYDPQYAEIQAQDVEDYAQGATEETALAEQEYADAEECGDDGYGDPGTGAVDVRDVRCSWLMLFDGVDSADGAV